MLYQVTGVSVRAALTVQELQKAIDSAETGHPLYLMINACYTILTGTDLHSFERNKISFNFIPSLSGSNSINAISLQNNSKQG